MLGEPDRPCRPAARRRPPDQFLDVISRDAAQARFQAALDLRPLGEEQVGLAEARGRVLARDVVADVDVPGFDRAGVDGFAVRAGDTAGATAAHPVRLRLNDELLTPGVLPAIEVRPGTASVIATGGMLPRGADTVVRVEQTEADPQADGSVLIEFAARPPRALRSPPPAATWHAARRCCAPATC